VGWDGFAGWLRDYKGKTGVSPKMTPIFTPFAEDRLKSGIHFFRIA
jgi:hypothetical protein